MSGDEPIECPLCLEELDVTDRNFKPCTCGYQVCAWCWHSIKEKLKGKCPACRQPYNDQNIQFVQPDPEEIAAQLHAGKERKRRKDKSLKSVSSVSRDALQNVRVLQKNLVYVVGLPPSIAREDSLRKREHFGRFGRIVKVAISRKQVHGASANQPSFSAYITYKRNEDATRAIQAVHGSTVDGRLIRATYGTTKYCSFFLRHVSCNNPNCLYLHDLADEADCYTKEDLQNTDRFALPVHAPSNPFEGKQSSQQIEESQPQNNADAPQREHAAAGLSQDSVDEDPLYHERPRSRSLVTEQHLKEQFNQQYKQSIGGNPTAPSGPAADTDNTILSHLTVSNSPRANTHSQQPAGLPAISLGTQLPGAAVNGSTPSDHGSIGSRLMSWTTAVPSQEHEPESTPAYDPFHRPNNSSGDPLSHSRWDFHKFAEDLKLPADTTKPDATTEPSSLLASLLSAPANGASLFQGSDDLVVKSSNPDRSRYSFASESPSLSAVDASKSSGLLDALSVSTGQPLLASLLDPDTSKATLVQPQLSRNSSNSSTTYSQPISTPHTLSAQGNGVGEVHQSLNPLPGAPPGLRGPSPSPPPGFAYSLASPANKKQHQQGQRAPPRFTHNRTHSTPSNQPYSQQPPHVHQGHGPTWTSQIAFSQHQQGPVAQPPSSNGYQAHSRPRTPSNGQRSAQQPGYDVNYLQQMQKSTHMQQMRLRDSH